MHIRKFFLSLVCIGCMLATTSCSRGAWRATVIAHNTPMVVVDGCQYLLDAASSYQTTTTSFSSELGTGKEIHVTGAVTDAVSFDQVYYLLDNAPYLLTRLTLTAAEPISSNYLAPICTADPLDLMPKDTANRVLFVPYDNDEWITYASYAFGREQNAYEVGALYNEITHLGLILGSVEHTDWKSALTSVTNADGTIASLTLYAGAADDMTRDSIPHGALQGTRISSPLMMVGRFDDWRTGMETYADLCAKHAPSFNFQCSTSNFPKPFGWNSWGVIAGHLNRDNAFQSAEFICEQLYRNGFQNVGTCYVGLDSFWDNIPEDQRIAFAAYCNEHGMKAGIYWTPWVDWAAREERDVEGVPGVKYKDIWLYRNGRPVKRNNACALDPTHPATKARAEYMFGKFIEWGYSYLKMDFMIHGAQEADSWYNPAITTGTQAYNYGMRYLDSLAAGHLYLNLSIAPVFPANYAQGRRIACDAWAAVKDTKYTLNATTYSWWLDRIYCFNDGDHVVLKGQPESVNRLRITSSVITGAYCLGDDFSEAGEVAAKEKAVSLACNPRVLEMARITKAFRPLVTPLGNEPSNQFYYTTPDAVYVALLNYNDTPCEFSISLHQLGLNNAQSITELWSGESLASHLSPLTITVPETDCVILQINK